MTGTLPTSSQQNTDAPAAFSPVVIAIVLVVFGAGGFWLYYWARDLHRFIQGISGYIALFIAEFAIYLLACYVATRKLKNPTRRMTLLTAAIILLFAAAFRFDLVPQRPYLSSDVYRYIWDGRVQANGINPYRYIPSAPEIDYLRDDKIYPKINRSDYYPTPYPPAAQMIFLLAHMIYPSVTGFKALMSVFDLLAIIAVMITLARSGQNPAQAIIFAWHPLLIFESSHTGHIESGFIIFLALALLTWSYKKDTLTGVMLALAALVKFYPALLLPLFLRVNDNDSAAIGQSTERAQQTVEKLNRQSLIRIVSAMKRRLKTLFNKSNIKLLSAFIVTIVLAYLPYLSIGFKPFASLSNEFNEEGFTGGTRYFLLLLLRHLLPVPTLLFLLVAVLALIALVWWWMVKPKPGVEVIAHGAMALIGLYFFISTPRYPWYYAWILPFVCFAPRSSWIYLTGASVLLYCVWFTPSIYPDIPLWIGAAMFVPTFAFLLRENRQNHQTEAQTSLYQYRLSKEI